MNIHSSLSGIIRALAFILLCSATGAAFATPTFGTRLDAYCATQPTQATAPQQSRPYRASNSSCLLCHTSANATANNLNTLGAASLSCNGATCGTTVNPFCVAHAPSGASITAPPAGTTVTQGQSLTYTAANATNPDGFPLVYTWLFTGGMPNAVGQSVSVPMTVAGSITSTLNVTNSVGMLATGTPPTRTVTVTTAALPALTVTPASLTFSAQAGGNAPAAQSLSVTSNGAQVGLSATASTSSGDNWLSVAPASSTTPSTLNVSVNPAGLAAGTYSGTVTITGAASNSPRTVAVTFTVAGAALPALTVSQASLTFMAQAGGSAPAAQSLSVTSSGAQVSLSATASTSSGGSWLSVAPAGSTTPSTLTVSVDPAGLAAGTYSGTVTIAGAASNSPQTVAVTLNVTAGGQLPVAVIVAPAINVSVLPGGRVTFRGAATDPANLPVTYRWTFQGGQPSRSTRQNPGAVTFRNPGSYTVTLTVTNRQGVSSLPATRVITVAQPNANPRLSEECLENEDHREHADRGDRKDRDEEGDHRAQEDSEQRDND
jgi:hypothetical protein